MVFDPARTNLSQPLRLHYAIAAGGLDLVAFLARMISPHGVP